MADLSRMLAKAKKTWTETVDKAGSTGISFPDGKYVMQWVGTEAKEATTGTLGISNQFLILEGEKEGETYYQWINLFNQDDELSSFVVQFLRLVTGSDPADLDIEQLETILEDAMAEDQVYAAILKTTTSRKDGQDYQNLRLGRRLEDYSTESAEEQKAEIAPGKTTEPKKGATTKLEAAAKSVKPAKVVEPEPVEDEEEDDEEEEEPPFEKGDEVTFVTVTGKGKAAKSVTTEGTILSVDMEEGTAEVKTGGTDKKPISQTVDLESITAVESEEKDDDDGGEEDSEEGDEEGTRYEVGDEVTFTNEEDEEVTGTITGIDEDEEEFEVEVKVGKKKISVTVPFANVVNEDEDEEEGELEIGSPVEFTDPKNDAKQIKGKVVAIDEDTAKVSVKVGAKTMIVDAEDLILLEEDTE